MVLSFPLSVACSVHEQLEPSLGRGRSEALLEAHVVRDVHHMVPVLVVHPSLAHLQQMKTVFLHLHLVAWHDERRFEHLSSKLAEWDCHRDLEDDDEGHPKETTHAEEVPVCFFLPRLTSLFVLPRETDDLDGRCVIRGVAGGNLCMVWFARFFKMYNTQIVHWTRNSCTNV